jgi:hypothetical protein
MLETAVKFLTTLYAAIVCGLIELRPIRTGGGAMPMFFPVAEIERVATRAIDLRDQADVYFGVAPRAEQASGKAAIDVVQTLWVDLDPDSPGLPIDIMSFPLTPSIVVSSGRGYHVYWVLTEPIDVPRAERLNRGLAEHLGTDPRVANADRILRVPGTINHKDGSDVRLLDCTDTRHNVEAVEAALGETHAASSPKTGRTQAPVVRTADDDEVSPAVENVLARLRGVRRTTNGWTAHCPAHDDQTPSLSISEGEDGRALLNCHAGCATETVVSAIGLTMADLFVQAPEGESTDSDRKRVAGVVVWLAEAEGVELFHDRQREAYASFSVAARSDVPDHHETHRIDSRSCALWLRGLYFRHCGEAVGETALKDAVALLAARAVFAGPERDVHRRLAGDLDRIYVDLGDAAWRVVEVTADGWKVLDRAPVVFVRDGSALALPEPETGGSLDELRTLTNFATDADWAIFRGALIGAFHPRGPYLLLLLLGPEGTAKTTTAKHFYGGLTDPQVGAFPVGTPRGRDIAVSAMASRVVGFDNVGKIDLKLSDLLCQLISGGGVRERLLYTNGEVFAGELRVLVVMTARTMVVREADLIDRTVIARLRALGEHERREESAVLAELADISGRVVGGLLDAVAGALREHPETRPPGLPRLADITRFVTAAEKAMGWDVGSFQRASSENQAASLMESIEGSPYALAVVAFMETREDWEGTSTQLLTQLSKANETAARQHTWPKATSQATTELDRNTQVLLAHDIEYTRHRHSGGNRQRVITLKKVQRDAGRDGTRLSDGGNNPKNPG